MENKYLYDTHIHTVETSPCGRIPAAETVDYYAAHGYSGLVITDHLHSEFRFNFLCAAHFLLFAGLAALHLAAGYRAPGRPRAVVFLRRTDAPLPSRRLAVCRNTPGSRSVRPAVSPIKPEQREGATSKRLWPPAATERRDMEAALATVT